MQPTLDSLQHPENIDLGRRRVVVGFLASAACTGAYAQGTTSEGSAEPRISITAIEPDSGVPLVPAQSVQFKVKVNYDLPKRTGEKLPHRFLMVLVAGDTPERPLADYRKAFPGDQGSMQVGVWARMPLRDSPIKVIVGFSPDGRVMSKVCDVRTFSMAAVPAKR